ncbi:hypothetical protein [Corynebacterium tapiri]|uniref:hypothetical protein n=1 Tax=Corynebacterium tapiri TaxID=1448266 RepID=UPI0015D5DF60|nr:hypothetical protein [Corynebacterium tapiri]
MKIAVWLRLAAIVVLMIVMAIDRAWIFLGIAALLGLLTAWQLVTLYRRQDRQEAQ